MKMFPLNELFVPNTKFGFGSLCLAIVGFKILMSILWGTGFDRFLVTMHGGLAVIGVGLCLWGTMEKR
jgi:hypothetical protein